jgi:signal-transduction protein with cAMP-binding, CBS, and nucleotidyltransferase domain
MDLARNLKIDSVSRLHPGAARHVSPSQSVAEAIALMRREQVGGLLVCEGMQVVGIFTERDLMRRVLACGKPLTIPVAECMTPDPVVVHPKEPVGAAVQRMEEGGYRHLPVVDEAGRPLGILSVKRIVHYLVEHFPSTIYNLPPNPSAVHREREGA